ncbi:MAG: HIT family protein [Erysipelotrichaceae bacterium]|nr:HIT family protein [Erysipelotrichaceae bacterium]
MCIFCEIIAGNIPGKKIYEDEEFLAILDISQTTKGHTLVMPKKHYENFLEMPADEFGRLMETVQKTAAKVVENMHANGCNILINTNEIAGQTVMHAHVHIIPRYDEYDTVGFMFKPNELDLDAIQKQINQD